MLLAFHKDLKVCLNKKSVFMKEGTTIFILIRMNTLILKLGNSFLELLMCEFPSKMWTRIPLE